MLLRENQLFGCTRPKPRQGSVPAGLTFASDFGFRFQHNVGSSLVLRRPIETTALTGKVKNHLYGDATHWERVTQLSIDHGIPSRRGPEQSI
jgi:hypothetical protein